MKLKNLPYWLVTGIISGLIGITIINFRWYKLTIGSYLYNTFWRLGFLFCGFWQGPDCISKVLNIFFVATLVIIGIIIGLVYGKVSKK